MILSIVPDPAAAPRWTPMFEVITIVAQSTLIYYIASLFSHTTDNNKYEQFSLKPWICYVAKTTLDSYFVTIDFLATFKKHRHTKGSILNEQMWLHLFDCPQSFDAYNLQLTTQIRTQ
jgi:hypothetical protein